MGDVRRSALAVFALAALLPASGCAPRQQPQQRPAVAPAPPPAELRDEAWGRFRSQRQGLSVPFPDGDTWRIDDHSTEWLDAKHPETASRLRARVWHEPMVMSRQQCEARARARTTDLPELDPEAVIDEVILGQEPSNPNCDWRARVGIAASDQQGGRIDGYVISFGAEGRTCIAVVFETSVRGANASDVIAARLELGVRMLRGTVLRSRIPTGPLEPR